MFVPAEYRLKNTIKYPTTIIVGGLNNLGIELTASLLEQGGYVVLIDTLSKDAIEKLKVFGTKPMLTFLDFSAVPHLEEDIRRVDYVFYFGHESVDFRSKVSTTEFLTFSNYLDAALSLAAKFEAKFLLTTSIKANQILQSDFDLRLAGEKHPVYTEMELQKYAEGLVLEYAENVNLEAKVVRLGELIGEGMDFTIPSTFTRLILNASDGNSLELTKDGLESEWFIHLKDAVYGLIKAQFTKTTKGKIYSVSYDNAYTHLSIAYRIQDTNDLKNEIRFVESDDNLPPIRPYKPAPNLSDIGWMPKVTFDKAVKESLMSAKIYLSEQRVHKVKSSGNENFSAKLKNFMTLAKKDDKEQDIFKTESDVLAELVTQNKKKQDQKKEGISKASKTLKIRKARRTKSQFEKMEDDFWKFFIGLSGFFGFLKKKSPLEIASLIVFGIIFLILYILVIAPSVFTLKNIYVVNKEYSNIEAGLDNKDYASVRSSALRVNEALSDIKKTFGKYKGVSDVLTLDNEYDTIEKSLDSYINISSSFNDIVSGIEPVTDYAKNFQNNTEIRNGSESYLSVSAVGTDYSQTLAKTTEGDIYIKTGIDQFETGVSELAKIDYSQLPTFLAKRFSDINERLNRNKVSIININNQVLLPELVGANEPKNHLVILLDNTRQTAVGGEMVGFALISFSKGSVSNVIVQPIEGVNVPTSLKDEVSLDMLNNTRFSYKVPSNLVINDYTGMINFQEFADRIKPVFETNYNKDIDSVTVINLNFLEDVLSLLRNNGIDVNLSGTNFEGNLLTALSVSGSSNQNLTAKHETLSKLLATGIWGSFELMKTNYPDILSVINKNYDNQNFYSDLSTFDFDSDNNMDLNLTNVYSESDSYVKVGINLDDQRIVFPEAYPDVSLRLESTILSGAELNNKMQIQFGTPGSRKEISVCLPLTVSTSSVKIEDAGFDQTRIAINQNNSEKCVSLLILDETKLTLSWSDFGIFPENLNEFDFRFGIAKVNGAKTTLDYSLNVNNGLKVISSNQDVSFSNNSISFFKNLLRDEVLSIKLSK